MEPLSILRHKFLSSLCIFMRLRNEFGAFFELTCPLNQSKGSGPGKDIGSHDKLCAISQNFEAVNLLAGGTASEHCFILFWCCSQQDWSFISC